MKQRMTLESIPFPAMLAAGLVLCAVAMAGAREVGGWIGAAYAQREIAAGRAPVVPAHRTASATSAAPASVEPSLAPSR
ncbi:MAG: hypothetical protein ACKVZJ_15080 [Phycisphaerales bacterium]